MKQPEALRLADSLAVYTADINLSDRYADAMSDAAAELRRQHALIAELREFIERAVFIRDYDCAKRDQIIDKIEAKQ